MEASDTSGLIIGLSNQELVTLAISMRVCQQVKTITWEALVNNGLTSKSLPSDQRYKYSEVMSMTDEVVPKFLTIPEVRREVVQLLVIKSRSRSAKLILPIHDDF